MLKKCIVLGLIIIFLSTSIINAEEIVKQKKDYGAVWRSAILPGWGHVYLGKKAKGRILMISDIVLVTGAILTYQMSNSSYNKYKETIDQSEIDKYYNEANQYHLTNNYLTLGALAVWTYSIIDVYRTMKKVKQTSYFNNKKEQIIFVTYFNQINVIWEKQF